MNRILLQGAVLLQALRAAAGDLEHPHDPHDDGAGSVSAETSGDGVPAETAGGGQTAVQTSSSLADALLVLGHLIGVGDHGHVT